MKSGEESPGEVTGTTLEELERFRQDIERYRARRKAVSEEFEGFVRGFKNPVALPASPPQDRLAPTRSSAPAPVAMPAPPVSPRPAAPVVAVPEVRPTPPVADPRPRAPLADVRPTLPAPERHAPPGVAPARPARRSWLPMVIVAALLVVVVAAWQFGRTPSSTSATDAPAAVATAPPAATPAPAAAPAPPPDPSESVLTTTRAVWLRVTADGNRIVSRELPAGARVPFKAEKSIEIRAGDAGAVRLSIGGRDQGALGADGAVVTRSFTVPR